MYIIPNGETATGMHSLPYIAISLAVIMILGLFLIKFPYDQSIEQNIHFKKKSLHEKILMAEQNGQIPPTLAEELLDNLDLIEHPEFRQNIPFEIQNTYKEIKSAEPLEHLSLSDLDFKKTVHALLSQSLFLFFLCLMFFLLASFYLEHIFSPIAYSILLTLLFLGLLAIHADKTYTWDLPLESVFPVITLSLWALVLRMGLKSNLSCAVGIIPVKGLSGTLMVPTLILPFLFLGGLFIETALYGTFQYAANEAQTVLVLIFVLMLVPFVVRTRLKAEVNTSEFRIGNRLNKIETNINTGELEKAKEQLRKLEQDKMTYFQEKSFGELAWKAGMREMVRMSYNRQLLKFEGSESDKEQLVKKMLNSGMKVPGSHYEKLFKKAIRRHDLSTFRMILPYLKDQKEATQKELQVDLRAKISEAMEKKDYILLEDLKNNLSGITLFSPLVTKMESYRREVLEGEIYVDNYAVKNDISKLIQIDLHEIEKDVIVMELPNQTQQRVPWSAVRGLMGVFIHSKPCAVLILEFKKKLFACQFFEDNLKGSLQGSEFDTVWQLFLREQPGTLPVTDLKEFDTISQEDLIPVCQTFLKG